MPVKKKSSSLFILPLVVLLAATSSGADKRWLRTARIAAPDLWVGMTDQQIQKTIDELANQGVNAVDLDLSYAPISDQLITINRVLDYARGKHPGMSFFVYQAPLEVVSENVDSDRNGRIDPGKTSMFSEHPDWAQRGLGGEPAVFYGADAGAFWVGAKDEDLWLCPNDPEYKSRWSDEITKIVETGVDGVYVDVPFLRGWFDRKRDWRWACACSDCAAKFKTQYGQDIPAKADWSDPAFRCFVRFRFEQIESFVAELRKVVKQANPKTALIIEHWDGITDVVETACDPALIARYSDARCHEWTNANGTCSSYGRYSWLEDMVRYLYYKGVDGGDPCWILAYTNRNDTKRMKALAALQLTAGCNFWETDKPDMAGSVNENARTELFGWITENSKLYYRKKIVPITRIALLHSRDSIVFHDFRQGMEPWRCAEEFLGIGMILLQLHLPFVVTTPSELDSLNDIDVLFLPNAACLSDEDADSIRQFVQNGGKVISTGDTGEFDEDGEERSASVLSDVFGTGNPGQGVTVNSFGNGKAVVTGRRFGSDFYNYSAPWRRRPAKAAKADKLRNDFRSDVWSKIPGEPVLETDADPYTILLPYRSGKERQVKMFRIDGISGNTKTTSVKLNTRMSGQLVVSFVDFLKSGSVPLSLGSDSFVSASLAMHGVLVYRPEAKK